MRSQVGAAYDEVRSELAITDVDILTDTCRLIIEGEEYEDVPCELSGGSGDVEGASYRIRFAWGSPAVIGATAIVDVISGRPQLTLQLVGPVDSSTAIWQEWRCTSGPAFGRTDVGL